MPRNRERTPDHDKTMYPRHVPTLREQAEVMGWDLEDVDSVRRMESWSAKGVLVNPMTHRSHYEDEYDADTPRERMDNHSGRDGRTLAANRGPDHPDTVFPSALYK